MERQQKRNVPPSVTKKKTDKVNEKKTVAAMDPTAKARLEQIKQMPKVKITGTASTTPRVSASLSKAQPVTTAKPKSRRIKSMGNK